MCKPSVVISKGIALREYQKRPFLLHVYSIVFSLKMQSYCFDYLLILLNKLTKQHLQLSALFRPSPGR
jgi:hypothetical protein